MTIAGNSEFDFPMTLLTQDPGVFTQQLHFFLDVNDSLVEKVIEIEGTAAAKD
jgi:hypothetical protein